MAVKSYHFRPTAAGHRDSDKSAGDADVVAAPGLALASGDAIGETTVDVTITPNGAYTSMRVLLDGDFVESIAGNATSYQYEDLLGSNDYDLSIVGVIGLIQSNPSAVLSIRTDQPTPPVERKFNAGHYVELPPFQTQPGEGVPTALANQVANDEIPGLKGVFKRYEFKLMNPSAGVFNWTEVDADFASCKASGLRFVILIVDRVFSSTVSPLPADMSHLVGLLSGANQPGMCGFRWNTEYQARYNALTTAIAARYDSDPMFEGLAFQESAVNLTAAEQTQYGYTKPLYRDGLIAMLRHACDALATSRVFWYFNFMNSGAGGAATGPDYLRAVAEGVRLKPDGSVRTGFTMGGPDIEPGADNLEGNNGPYQLYPEFRGRVPLFCAAQFNSHEWPAAKSTGPDSVGGQEVTGPPWETSENIFLYARDSLFCDYVIWTRDNVGPRTFDADDIPVINTYADFDNPTIPEPEVPTIAFVSKTSTSITVSIATTGVVSALIPRIDGVDQTAIPVTGQYTFFDLSPSTAYSLRFKAANSSGTSAASNTVSQTTNAAAVANWLVLDPPGVEVIHGVAGFGTNQAGGFYRGTTDTIPQLYIVDTLSGGSSGNTTTRRGSFRWCATRTGRKIIIFTVSGVIDLLGNAVNVDATDTCILGETAPSPGIHFINGCIRLRANNLVLTHVSHLAQGTGTVLNKADWDGIAVGHPNRATSNVLVHHVSQSGGYDEGWQIYSANGHLVDNVTFSQCISAENLNVAGHPEGAHSKGPFIGESVDHCDFHKCALLDNVDRNPFTRGLNVTLKDCLMYNYQTAGVIIAGRGAADGEPTNTNILDCLFVRGPNTPATRKCVTLVGTGGDTPILDGSHVYMDGCVNVGNGYTTQAQMRGNSGTVVSGIIVNELIAAAYAAGLVREPISDARVRAVKLLDTCGHRPADRASLRDGTVLGHVINTIDGTTPQGAIVNSIPVPVLANNTIADPTAGGAYGGDPLVLSDLTTMDGTTGRSRFEAWRKRRSDAIEVA